MKLVHPDSLAATLDALNDAFFSGQKLPPSDIGLQVPPVCGRLGLDHRDAVGAKQFNEPVVGYKPVCHVVGIQPDICCLELLGCAPEPDGDVYQNSFAGQGIEDRVVVVHIGPFCWGMIYWE